MLRVERQRVLVRFGGGLQATEAMAADVAQLEPQRQLARAVAYADLELTFDGRRQIGEAPFALVDARQRLRGGGVVRVGLVEPMPGSCGGVDVAEPLFDRAQHKARRPPTPPRRVRRSRLGGNSAPALPRAPRPARSSAPTATERRCARATSPAAAARSAWRPARPARRPTAASARAGGTAVRSRPAPLDGWARVATPARNACRARKPWDRRQATSPLGVPRLGRRRHGHGHGLIRGGSNLEVQLQSPRRSRGHGQLAAQHIEQLFGHARVATVQRGQRIERGQTFAVGGERATAAMSRRQLLPSREMLFVDLAEVAQNQRAPGRIDRARGGALQQLDRARPALDLAHQLGERHQRLGRRRRRSSSARSKFPIGAFRQSR